MFLEDVSATAITDLGAQKLLSIERKQPEVSTCARENFLLRCAIRGGYRYRAVSFLVSFCGVFALKVFSAATAVHVQTETKGGFTSHALKLQLRLHFSFRILGRTCILRE